MHEHSNYEDDGEFIRIARRKNPVDYAVEDALALAARLWAMQNECPEPYSTVGNRFLALAEHAYFDAYRPIEGMK